SRSRLASSRRTSPAGCSSRSRSIPSATSRSPAPAPTTPAAAPASGRAACQATDPAPPRCLGTQNTGLARVLALSRQRRKLGLKDLPGPRHVPLLGTDVPDRQPQRVSPVEAGGPQEHLPGGADPPEQPPA